MEISLQLSRPLAVLDLETTGLKPDADRIVEIAIVKIHPDGKTAEYVKRVNPQIPIPPEAAAIHGIRDEDVTNEPPFKEIAQEVAHFLFECDLGGFNLTGYDLRLLLREFERSGIKFSLDNRAIVDAKQIYHAREPRTLEAACRFYLNESHEHAHSVSLTPRCSITKTYPVTRPAWIACLTATWTLTANLSGTVRRQHLPSGNIEAAYSRTSRRLMPNT
jgi:DNA polymerase III subunit epsilon